MKLTEPEIIALLNLHSGNIVDIACEVMAGGDEVSDIHRTIDRIRELIAMLPHRGEKEEMRTMQ